MIPGRDDPNDVPGDLARIFETVDSQFVLQAPSYAARDATYRFLPEGRLVVVTSDMSIWLKTSDTDATWSNGGVKDSGWVDNSSGWSASSGWSINYRKYRTFGPVVSFMLGMVRTGADITASADGDVYPDVEVCYVPSGIAPTGGFDFYGTAQSRGKTWGIVLRPDGKLLMRDGNPGAVLTTDEYFRIFATYMIGA